MSRRVKLNHFHLRNREILCRSNSATFNGQRLNVGNTIVTGILSSEFNFRKIERYTLTRGMFDRVVITHRLLLEVVIYFLYIHIDINIYLPIRLYKTI